MDVQINEMTTTVEATDGQTLLTPALMQQIVRAVMAELEASRTNAVRQQRDRQLNPGASRPRRSGNQ